LSKPVGVVATPHYLATEVGIGVLRDGGNAFDAAVAVGLAIGVVQPYHSGIGGGCSITYVTAEGQAGSIQARGRAPEGLDRSLLLEPTGTPDYERARTGPLAMVVPALVSGLHQVHEAHGQLSWQQVCLAPQPLARDGFLADFMLARNSGEPKTADKLKRFAAGTSLEESIREGRRLIQPAMSTTLVALADDPIALYTGEIAHKIASRVESLGGVLAASDLEAYQAQSHSLNEGSYRGWRILAPGTPTIGALQALLALQILDHFPLEDLAVGSAEHIHLLVEAIKLSYMARASIESDAEAIVLADRKQAKRLAAQIRRDRTLPFEQFPVPSDLESSTSHFCVADVEGNVVSQTQTIGGHYGSGIVEPETGIVLNNLVGDFSLQVGDVTTQGIRYGHYNLLEPGLEPASSQSPLIALNSETGEMLAAGAAGGPKIVSATVQALVNCIDFGMNARGSANAPRVHCHGQDVELESGLGGGLAAQLEDLGHSVRAVESIALMQIIRRTGGGWEGAADPRSPGSASTILQDGESTPVHTYGYTIQSSLS
jgi:gamma-glutamyltranspeptidase/glutathione hydrolase